MHSSSRIAGSWISKETGPWSISRIWRLYLKLISRLKWCDCQACPHCFWTINNASVPQTPQGWRSEGWDRQGFVKSGHEQGRNDKDKQQGDEGVGKGSSTSKLLMKNLVNYMVRALAGARRVVIVVRIGGCWPLALGWARYPFPRTA